VVSAEQVTTLAGFDTVVLGSAVYMGHWLAPARDLAERLAREAAGRPVWLFSSGPLGDPPKPAQDAVDVAPLLASTGAHGLFLLFRFGTVRRFRRRLYHGAPP
jgi:menaquinone-dependent protoporphyrinogen oxidase